MGNFSFLKKNSEKLYKIIVGAENLFRDEYFEQTAVQTRRFAENLCRDILQDKVQANDTFDDMINKIKDNSFGNIRMKEFYDDLYFLKKQGNNFAHASSSAQDGKIALECLERSYEIAIFYSNIKFGYDKKLDNKVFSEELLMTGKQTSNSKPLKVKYSKELKKAREDKASKPSVKSRTNSSQGKKNKQSKKQKSKSESNNFAWIIIAVMVILYIVLKIYS